MRIIIFLSTVLLMFSACKKSGSGNDSPPAAVALTLTDVAYSSDAKQKMDIYLPAGRSADSTKLLFLIHGGGWTEGDKADFTAAVDGLRTRFPNYAFVNVNYRLAVNGQNLFPTQENDIKAATALVFNKRNEYLVSDKWAFLGASAGGHLALLQAYKYSSPVKPKAVISFFGPSELTALYNTNLLAAFALAGVTGGTPATHAAIYQQSSPYTFITAQSPPTMLLHGGADPLVPPSQSTIVRDKLQLLGVPQQYVFYPDAGHGWDGTNLLDSFDKIAVFLQTYMN